MRMIRVILGIFMLMIAESQGSLQMAIMWGIGGLCLSLWPALTGYFSVVPERYYLNRQ